MITFECTSCGQKFQVADEYAGKEVICKDCKVMITVPSSGEVHSLAFDTSYDACGSFMAQNYELFQALLKHEKEAPAVEIGR